MITNKLNVPLGLAVWAVDNDYDYVHEPDYISATSLLKPVKAIILGNQVDEEVLDVEDFIAAAFGTTLHAGIEKAWKVNYKKNLAALGYPENLIERVKINPGKDEIKEDTIPIYLERRSVKELNGMKIGGKFDMVADGILQDNKSTSTYTYIYGNKDDDYKLQGSIYRWLNPDIIHEDFIRINFIFTDWQRAQAKINPDYPQSRLLSKDIPLMSKEETEAWIAAKVHQIQIYKNKPQNEMPECTDEELWRSETKFKYYADPSKTGGRSTKNFSTKAEATEYMKSKGKGVVLEVPGEVKRCQYCRAYSVCEQRRRYFDD